MYTEVRIRLDEVRYRFARAGKNLRFLKKRFRFLGFLGFLRFLGFNVSTVARGTLDTGIRSRRRPIHED